MTPAAFAQTETPRDAFIAPRREEGSFRTVRGSRRLTLAFNADAQTPLFHAWRP